MDKAPPVARSRYLSQDSDSYNRVHTLDARNNAAQPLTTSHLPAIQPMDTSATSTSVEPQPIGGHVNGSMQQPPGAGARPRRQKSLVRPERERIDPNHRQYHYRQRAVENLGPDQVAISSTGNAPLGRGLSYRGYNNYDQEDEPRASAGGNVLRSLSQRVPLRRGKSILGREEPRGGTIRRPNGRQASIRQRNGAAAAAIGATGEPVTDQHLLDENTHKKNHDAWMIYCYALTCCFPGNTLSIFGKHDVNSQRAFREKIGLLSLIVLICAAVGFLTFGFTQAVCPAPPLTFHAGSINSGYFIINGWAYQLASWKGHPPIPGLPDTVNNTNPLYNSLNAGGMDGSFLFQTVNQNCLTVIQPKSSAISTIKAQKSSQNSNYYDVPTYFPCRMFNPNNTVPPDSNTYLNYSGCHLTPTARNAYYNLEKYGAQDANGQYEKGGQVYYDWTDVNSTKHLVVYNGMVLNIDLLKSLPMQYFDIPANGLLQTMMASNASSIYGGTDITHVIESSRNPNTNFRAEADCMADIIKVGVVDTSSIGCIASQIVLYASLCVILGVIIAKFALAVIFGWFLSYKLGNFKESPSYKERMRRANEIENWTEDMMRPADGIRPQRGHQSNGSISGLNSSANSITGVNTKRKTFLPQTSRFTQPEFGSTNFDNSNRGSAFMKSGSGLIPNKSNRMTQYSMLGGSLGSGSFTSLPRGTSDLSRRSSFSSLSHNTLASGQSSCPFPLARGVVPQPPPDYQPFKFPLLHTICLVTCYSEGEEGLRTTLDSIATTDYPNSHKLILVVADGIITGHGNKRSTPDICVSMMKDFVIPKDQVQPYSYVAIADGYKRHNMAKVYAGFYKYDNETVDKSKQQRVPMITIVKCGTFEESNEKKPGNRGKRDSQIVLMSFLQKVMFDERMTLLEYEFFNNIWRVTGVSPDKYEVVLMVDADTKVYPDSLTRMIACMAHDPDIMGLCGETKIGNKTDSWVSMIQVFEYYISHHQAKAFESVFGGVTCLPGCFCMYRIKAPKGPNGYWVPILANPDIVERYSENVVDTLHKKNLLLLGEDRYLSTLMLKTFPKRKMMWCPQAVCKTVVPDSFRVLLSQRRRWINSTIHNLMELVMVRDLCGTFCFSMQFVVFMELVGTVALPAAISFTLYLVIRACLGSVAVIPLILLAIILGLPAVLIGMTSRKLIYVGWMFVYLFSLPIWNFVLPVYAYWHFDDFSWGETRRVAGGGKDSSHGDKEGEFDSSKIIMKRWAEYEKERKTKLAIAQGLALPKFIDSPKLKPWDTDFKVRERRFSDASNESSQPLSSSIVLPAGVDPNSFNATRYTTIPPGAQYGNLKDMKEGYEGEEIDLPVIGKSKPLPPQPPSESGSSMQSSQYHSSPPPAFSTLSMPGSGATEPYQPRMETVDYSPPPPSSHSGPPPPLAPPHRIRVGPTNSAYAPMPSAEYSSTRQSDDWANPARYHQQSRSSTGAPAQPLGNKYTATRQ